MLTPGFLAKLIDRAGREHRHHGSGDQFIAASFETGAQILEPQPRGPTR